MYFKQKQKDVHDNARSKEPKTQRTYVNVDRVRTLVSSDRRLCVQLIAEKLNTNKETVLQILEEDFGMRKNFLKAGALNLD